MIFTEEAEEALEKLWTESERTKDTIIMVSAVVAAPGSQVFKELIDNKVIEMAGSDKVRITATGLECAKDAVRRHRLAERLLTDVLAVKSSLIHDAACKFEHHLHRGIDENVCTLLGHPKFCPHGQPIPPGKCCEENARIFEAAVSPLSMIRPGEGGRVAYIHTQEPKRAQMLISMGVVPGTEIRLLAGFPSYLFQLGEGQFAVDRSIAGDIYVRLYK